jgi:hypothetical protein
VCLPVALFWGAVVVGLGARDEYGFVVGFAIVLIGFVLAGLAVHEIRRAPDRYRGYWLAKVGLSIPVALGAGFVVLLIVVSVVQKQRREESRSRAEAARAEETDAVERLPHQTEAAVRAQARAYLARLVALDDAQNGEDVRRMVDPEFNTLFLGRERDEFENAWFEGARGLAMFDHSALGYPLSEFAIDDVEFDPDDRNRATVTIACHDESLRFGMVWSDRQMGDRDGPAWYLALEPIEHLGPRGRIWTLSERNDIRARIERLLFSIPSDPDPADLEPALVAIDPRERDRIRSLSVRELVALRERDELGMALVDPTSMPDGTPSSSADDVRVQGDEGTHTWHLGKTRVTFPIVRVEGKWYLGVGRVRIVETR